MWVLPTYGRPGRCQETLDSIAVGQPTEGVVIVDGDPDPAYQALRLPAGWNLFSLSSNLGVCGVLNWLTRQRPHEPWYGFISDDSIVRTPDWSAPLVRAAGPAGFASSADGWQGERRMHGAVVFGGELLRTIGWWAPPGLRHSFVDDAWEALAKGLGNWTRVPSVMVEHRHAWNGKAERDATYDRAYASIGEDERAWHALGPEIEAAIARAAPLVERHATPQRERMARARTRSVFIAMPIARMPTTQCMNALCMTVVRLAQLGIRAHIEEARGQSNIARARNELAAKFLASDYTDCLFIDDDMGWTPNDVIRLLASPQPLVAGVGAKKRLLPDGDSNKWCCRFLPGDIAQDPMGNIEVEAVGAAFMKISREVFEALISAHPDWKRNGWQDMARDVRAKYFRFFRFDDDHPGEPGEDFDFCWSWRALGGSVWIDPTIRLVHVGEMEFGGDITALFEAEAAAALEQTDEVVAAAA